MTVARDIHTLVIVGVLCLHCRRWRIVSQSSQSSTTLMVAINGCRRARGGPCAVGTWKALTMHCPNYQSAVTGVCYRSSQAQGQIDRTILVL